MICHRGILDKLLLDSYEETAEFLLCDVVLFISGHKYRIIEIEYYSLEDPYTHRHVQQYTPGRWYFHPKGGTYKGLDITVKNGSFLIRALIDLETNIITEGPCLVVNLIMSKLKIETVAELREKYIAPHCLNTNFKICLSKNLCNKTIYKSKRIGLRYTEDKSTYWNLKLRFLTYPNELKKGKKLLKEDKEIHTMCKHR